MKAQLKKIFPLTVMVLLLVLVVSLLPKEGAADKSLGLKQSMNKTAVIKNTTL